MLSLFTIDSSEKMRIALHYRHFIQSPGTNSVYVR